MIKSCIPLEDLERIAQKSNLSGEDILRKTRAIINLANTGQEKLVMQMIQNTRQEWLFESLLQGSIIENGRVKLGKILGSLKNNGEYFFALLLGNAPATCDLEPGVDRAEITELDLGPRLTSVDWVKKFATRLHPAFSNLVKIKTYQVNLNIDREFDELDETQKHLILRTIRACSGNINLHLETRLNKDFFVNLLDGFTFDVTLTGPGAKWIPEEIADVLCGFDGNIQLPDLEVLNSLKLARKLWQRFHKVALPKLTTISDDVVELLALLHVVVEAPLIRAEFPKLNPQNYTPAHLLTQKGIPLNLDAMETVPKRLWKIIALHNEAVSLNGLKHLDDRFALFLARHKHALSLDSLTSLSPRAKRLLQYHCWSNLSLKGLVKQKAQPGKPE